MSKSRIKFEQKLESGNGETLKVVLAEFSIHHSGVLHDKGMAYTL
jgi:hypothetical protein